MRTRESGRPSTKAVLACALALLLGACATEQWAKDSGEIATREIISECSQQAWSRARYAQMSNPSVPVQVLQQDKAGRATATYDSVRFPQSDVQEQNFFNLCMREKGYDLVPTKSEARR